MPSVCYFHKSFQDNFKLFILPLILHFLLIYECSTSQYNRITLDFGKKGRLEREPEQLTWSEFMVTRMENFENFQFPGIIHLEEFINMENFVLLEKLIKGDVTELNISFTKAVSFLNITEAFLISENKRLSFFRSFSKAIVSSENISNMQFQDEIQLETNAMCYLIVTLLECLCKESRIPFAVHFEKNIAMIYITEDISDIDLSLIEKKRPENIHLHISFSFLHFLTNGTTWSSHTSVKLFRAIYECNEITKRIVNFNYFAFSLPFWCYENLFGNVVIDTFKMRINAKDAKEISFLQDSLRRNLKIRILCVHLKHHHHFDCENFCNIEFLETLEILLEYTSHPISYISFSKYTLEKCQTLTVKGGYLTKNLYDTLLRMNNLKTLNLCDCITFDTYPMMKLWRNEIVTMILRVVDLSLDHRTVSSFLDNIKKHTKCSIQSLSLTVHSQELYNKFLNLFQNENFKKSLKTLELKVFKLTNSLCNAVLQCNELENLTLKTNYCIESLVRNSTFQCSTTLKSVNLQIASCSPELTCSIFDDFNSIERFSFAIRVTNETMNFCDNSLELIFKITALKIMYLDLNNYSSKWLDYALNVTKLNIYWRDDFNIKNVARILKLQTFVEKITSLTLYGLETPKFENSTLSDLVKKYQRLELLDWRDKKYNIVCSSLLFQNEWIKTLKELELFLHKDTFFFKALKESFESLRILRLRISTEFVFDENEKIIKNYFPVLKRLNIRDYHNELTSLEFRMPIVRAFNFVDIICFENTKLTFKNMSDFAFLVYLEAQRPTIIMITEGLSCWKDIVIFRDEFKDSSSIVKIANNYNNASNKVVSGCEVCDFSVKSTVLRVLSGIRSFFW